MFELMVISCMANVRTVFISNGGSMPLMWFMRV